jgi:hypothetical protein
MKTPRGPTFVYFIVGVNIMTIDWKPTAYEIVVTNTVKDRRNNRKQFLENIISYFCKRERYCFLPSFLAKEKE